MRVSGGARTATVSGRVGFDEHHELVPDAVEIEAAGLGAVHDAVDVDDQRAVAVIEIVAAAGANHIYEITTGAATET